LSIRSKLTISYLFIIIIIISFFGIISITLFNKYYIYNITDILATQGNSFAHFFDSYVEADINTIGQDVAKKLSLDTNAQVQILNMEGMLLGDSSVSGKPITAKIMAPDVLQAISGNEGVYLEKTKNEDIIHVSIPVKSKLNYVAVLRLSSSLLEVHKMIYSLILFFIIVLMFSSILALLIGIFIAKNLTKPINLVKDATSKMAKGDFKTRAKKISNDEIGILADSFNKMAEDLGRLNEMKNEFISNISHELRTPLTSIKGFAITAMDKTKDKEICEYLEIIDKESDRLAHLVDELLDFSRMELDNIKLNFEDLSLNELLNETILLLKPISKNYQIEIVYEQSDCEANIEGDKNRLKQVLVNIIDNGFKASASGSILKIVLYCDENNGVIKISDQGKGISPEELQYIFNKFYRGKNAKYSGTGIGLSIAKKIIEMHNGNIEVRSELNKGSDFIIKIPLKNKVR